ncbi:MAG: thiamine pyrophosphate-dependent enzyme [Sphingomicrobium sp.]
MTRGANRPSLELHIPEPTTRPADAVDFSAVHVPPAGHLARPDMAAKASEIAQLATALVRVLDDDGRAVGAWNPQLPTEALVQMLEHMLTVRIFEDRMFRAQRQGKTSFFLKSLGEEAVAVAGTHALDADDMTFPTYRQPGILVARGCSLIDMMCQIYSNRGDRLKGRQLPVMYSSRAHGFFGISGTLGTQCPQAVGWAMASALSGDTRIAATYIGDGATAEGDFHHACVFAAVYRAPVIINIVNNQWAISTFSGVAGAELTSFAARAIGYGIPGIRVDGNDALAVYSATQWAAERARANHGPTIIELFTLRVEGHSTSDDPSAYRPQQSAADWPLGDPIDRLKRHLNVTAGWDDARHAALIERITSQVRTAQREAEKLGSMGAGDVLNFAHEVSSMFDDVYETMPWHLVEQREQMLAELEAAVSCQ